MFRNIKTVKHIKAQSFLVDGFYGYSKYLKSISQIILHSSINQWKKFMTSKYHDFNYDR